MNSRSKVIETADCPRVLYIGINPIQRVGAEGITVANLFSGWDKRALAQLFVSDIEPDKELCSNSFRLSEAVFPVDYCLRALLGKAIKVDHPLTRKIGGVGPSVDDRLNLRVRLHLIARAINDLGPCVLPSIAARWIREFRPDVIYSSLGNARLMKIVIWASRVAGNVPIVPHFMDDWPSTLYADGRLWSIPKNIVDHMLRSLLRRAPMGFCIGESMAEEYKARYGRDFCGFMNCVDDEEFESSPPHGGSGQGPLIWAYVGGLHLNRWKPLALLAQCITAQGAILRIFAPERDLYQWGSVFSVVRNVETGTLAPEEVMKAMRQSDVLIHVESFDQAESSYTRFSVSTKLAQYLAAGRTIFGLGPAGLASLKLIKEARAGITVTNEDPAQVADAVTRTSNDPVFRLESGRKGSEYASVHFKKSVIRQKFRKILTIASEESVLN
jgi:glycosyltransferase involved in cell wall biosynthesis